MGGKNCRRDPDFTSIDARTTLAAFGGGGPLAATRVADAVGARRVIIPGMSAVFSAWGISFSPLSQQYRVTLRKHDLAQLTATIAECRARATKDMYAESVDINDCDVAIALLRERAGNTEVFTLNTNGPLPCDLDDGDTAVVLYSVEKKIQGNSLGRLGEEQPYPATARGTRRMLIDENEWLDVPVLRLEDQRPGAGAVGPAIIEEAFFTGFIGAGWTLTVSVNRDLLLEKQ